MRNNLALVLLLFSFVVAAQEAPLALKSSKNKNDISSYYTSGKKLGITAKDSLFQVNIGVRIQSRFTYINVENEDPIVEGEVRRLRLKMDGFVYNPKFGYRVQLGFSAKDMAILGVDDNGNILMDGVFYYKATNKVTLAFGQATLPGNNQRIVSSSALEFTDRTINNSRFNLDRDFGLFVEYSNEKENQFCYNLVGALTTGEGRNWTKKSNDGVSLTGKVELYPFGVFVKDGSHFEADLMREKTPKLMVAGAFNQNNNAVRTQGQLGSLLYEARTMQSLFLDSMLKYNGWAAELSYMNRNSDKPITVNPKDITQTRFVYVGEGVDAQLSYVFPSNYQVAARYSTQKAAKSIENLAADANDMSLSVSKYVLSHKLKFQMEYSYGTLKFADDLEQKTWYARLQVEIGI